MAKTLWSGLSDIEKLNKRLGIPKSKKEIRPVIFHIHGDNHPKILGEPPVVKDSESYYIKCTDSGSSIIEPSDIKPQSVMISIKEISQYKDFYLVKMRMFADNDITVLLQQDESGWKFESLLGVAPICIELNRN
jgi:hypothetical protein